MPDGMRGRGQSWRIRHVNVGAAFGTAARASRTNSNWATTADVFSLRLIASERGAECLSTHAIATHGSSMIWLRQNGTPVGCQPTIVVGGRVMWNKAITVT